MSRITRQIKTSILIVGEGPTERAFLQHLKEIYGGRYDNAFIKVDSGTGGSAECVVQKTIRLRSNRDYDKCYVLVDKIPEPCLDQETRRRMTLAPPIELLLSIPCIEGLLLEILGHNGFSRGWQSERCKSEFEKEYIPDKYKYEKYAYRRLFTKDRLEASRNKIQELNGILSIFETKKLDL